MAGLRGWRLAGNALQQVVDGQRDLQQAAPGQAGGGLGQQAQHQLSGRPGGGTGDAAATFGMGLGQGVNAHRLDTHPRGGGLAQRREETGLQEKKILAGNALFCPLGSVCLKPYTLKSTKRKTQFPTHKISFGCRVGIM